MKKWKLLPAVLALCLTAACSGGRELEGTALVRVLGVDHTPAAVTLTAVSGAQNLGAEPPEVLTATGETLELAREALKTVGEEYASTTHMTQLVAGSGAEIYPLLWESVLRRETGYSATLWLTAEGTAADLLDRAGGGVKRLEVLQGDPGVQKVSLLAALSALEEEGRVTLPVLWLEGGTLALAGYRTVTKE